MHGLFYVPNPEEVRAFIRDKLGFAHHDIGVTDEGWGLLTHFRMPGNLEVELYQPKYEKRSTRKTSKRRVSPRSRTKKRNPSR